MIKTAILADIPALVALEEICFDTDRLSARHYRHLIKSTSARVYIKIRRNRIIASAIIFIRKNSKVARLYSIAVNPDYQGKGLARDIYQTIEKYLHRRKIREFRLEVRKDNPRAVSFYEKNDFIVFGTIPDYYEDGMQAILMKKQLQTKPIANKRQIKAA